MQEKPEPTGDEGDPLPDNTADSAPSGPSYFEPAFLNVVAEFGWDASTQSLVDVVTSTGTAQAHILLEYGSASWETDEFSPSSEHVCIVEIPFTQSAPASWLSASATYWMGFDYDSADGLYTNCDLGDGLYDFDPAVWGEEPFAEIASYGWGMGVGEIPPALAAPYAGGPYESNVFGGIVPNTMFPYGEEDYVAVARQIDASYAVVLEDGGVVYLPSSAVNLGNNIATAWYLLVASGIWTFSP